MDVSHRDERCHLVRANADARALAVIPFAIFIAKRYGSRIASHTPLRWLADEIAGRSLAEALDLLDAIRRFKVQV